MGHAAIGKGKSDSTLLGLLGGAHEIEGAAAMRTALVVVDGLAVGEYRVSRFAQLLNARSRV